jgi:hypothetical protein
MSMQTITTLMLLGLFMFNLGAPAIASAQGSGSTSTLAGEFVSKLPIGTNTKLRLEDGRKIKATLMSVESDAIVVRMNTRLPEPPLRIELSRIVDADIDRGANLGRSIAAGTAAGAGAALGVFFLLVAIYSD